MAAGSSDELVGRAWQWQATELPGDRQIIPEAPERYTLQFMADGNVQVRADCNRGGAKYLVGANGALTLSPAFLTKMGCPPGSKDTEFVHQLGEVSGYRFVDGNVLLALKSGGSMRFAAFAR